MTIKGCDFKNNWAGISGGAIYATGFRFIDIYGDSSFNNNMAMSSGSEIEASNSIYNFTIDESIIYN